MFELLLRRELRASWKNLQTTLQPLLFFVLTTILFPIALGADNDSLAKAAPAALWIPLLLSTLLAGEQLFHDDFHSGRLSQDRLHLELWLVVLAKLVAVWLRLTLPLLILLPLLGVMLHIELKHQSALALLLGVGSLNLLTISSMGASLTLAQTHSTFLRYLIITPLYLPTLIIGIQATSDKLLGLAINGHYALLGALTLFSLLSLVPFTHLALKHQSLP